MGKRVASEIEKLCQNIDNLISEYHLRVSETSQPPKGSSFGGYKSVDILTL